MYNTKIVESKAIEAKRVEIGNDLSVVYIIDAEVFEDTFEPWGKNVEPGVHYSFIGALFREDDKIGESTMGRFATLKEVQQFAANYIETSKAA